jgi:hypothetical protein
VTEPLLAAVVDSPICLSMIIGLGGNAVALIKCKECGKDVSTQAKTCPNCGAKVVDPDASKNTLIGCVGIIVIVVVLSVLGNTCSGPSKPKTEAEKQEDILSDAFYMCQAFIEKNLRDPDSADFITRYNSSLVSKNSKGNYVVSMQVRAANGFGGKTVSVFTCELTPSGGDNWRLIDLNEIN